MKKYIKIFNILIPSYGLMILIGIVITTIIAYIVFKKNRKFLDYKFEDMILSEAYAALGAAIFSKIFYIMITLKENYIQEKQFFELIKTGGFVFYGGLVGAIIGILFCALIHKVKILKILNDYIFLVPLGHAFGRIGCFLAGCCYGISYDGVFSIVFPAGSFAPNGIQLFPVQILEVKVIQINK